MHLCNFFLVFLFMACLQVCVCTLMCCKQISILHTEVTVVLFSAAAATIATSGPEPGRWSGVKTHWCCPLRPHPGSTEVSWHGAARNKPVGSDVDNYPLVGCFREQGCSQSGLISPFKVESPEGKILPAASAGVRRIIPEWVVFRDRLALSESDFPLWSRAVWHR